jgi:hypothetical protein
VETAPNTVTTPGVAVIPAMPSWKPWLVTSLDADENPLESLIAVCVGINVGPALGTAKTPSSARIAPTSKIPVRPMAIPERKLRDTAVCWRRTLSSVTPLGSMLLDKSASG